MKEKLIAGLMAALMLVSPVLAATTVGNFYDSLGAPATGFYMVVGSAASVEDVVSATDAGFYLASLSYQEVSTGGVATAVNGIEKDTVELSDPWSATFPQYIRTMHFSGLKDSTFNWKSNDYDYYEQIEYGNIYMSHDFGTDKVNGTEKLVVESGEIAYDYVFDKAFNITAITGHGTIADPEYTYPINTVKLLGKPFVIVGLGPEQVEMLSGSVGTASSHNPVEYGDYKFYATMGSTNSLQIDVKDANDNLVETLTYIGITSGTVATKTTTKTSPALDVLVTSFGTLTDGTVVGADLVIGPTGAVEKTYTSTCDVTSTGTADTKFPGETQWCIQTGAGDFDDGSVAKGDELQVVYKPTDTQYLVAGEKVQLPNNYGEIGFLGWNTDKFAEITVVPFSERTVYDADTPSMSVGTYTGFEISSNVPGSIMDTDGSGYTKAYFIFNESSYAGAAFLDSVSQKLLLKADATHRAQNAFTFTFNISYAGSSALSEVHRLNFTADNSYPDVVNASTLAVADDTVYVNMAYDNRTAWTATNLPTFRLYDSTSAEDEDVIAATDGTYTVNSEIGKAIQNVVTDSGAIVVSPNSNSGSQRVVLDIPAETLYVKAYFGKIGAGATAGSTVHEVVPVTSAVALLDSEVTSTHKAANLVLVGGPCVNTLVADLATAGKFDYTCTGWPGRNFGLVQVIDGAFTTGKFVLVLAGTRAEDTRMACHAVQQYDTLLKGKTATAVEVTSLSATGIVEV